MFLFPSNDSPQLKNLKGKKLWENIKRHNNFQKYYYGYLFDWGNIAEKNLSEISIMGVLRNSTSTEYFSIKRVSKKNRLGANIFSILKVMRIFPKSNFREKISKKSEQELQANVQNLCDQR